MGMTAPRQGHRRAVAIPGATIFPAMQGRVPTASAAGAFVGFVVSLTPSLVPRSWLVQGIVSGLAAALGYALATLTSTLLRPLRRRRRPRGWPPWRRWLVLGTGEAAAAASLWLSLRWQQQLHLTMGVERPLVASFSLGVPIVAALLLASAVTIARGAAALACAVAARVERKVPAGLAALAAALVIALGLVAAQNLLARGLLGVTDRSFATLDDALTAELPPPRSPRVSGGPGSLVSWDSLGVQGRTFVSRVTPVAELEAFARSEALEPVRVYAGVSTAADDAERARLVVAELERAGGFEREVLFVVTPTGTGWVNPIAAGAIEHLYAGDTAIAAMQYAYLPSWLSVLVDRDRAAVAGRALIEQVRARWVELPADQRPKLLLYGESLGSTAAEGAFADLDDLRAGVDGAVLVGPPDFNPLWRELVAGRDDASPQRLPVVDGGRQVRFASEPADLDRPDGSWEPPRVAYFQHASDPVVWWSPRLAVQPPDWLVEPRGPDVLDEVRWIPLVTFLQLSADLATANALPAGHGHNYGSEIVAGLAALQPPDGWSDEDTRRLRQVLEERYPAR